MFARKILTVIFMAAIMISGGINAADAADPIVMKIATVWTSDDGSSVNKTINYLKPRIEQLTNGRVQVELKKGTLGGERDMFEGVQLGSIQAAALTTGTLGGFVPLAEIFIVPYIFRNWDHGFAVVNGPFGEELEKMALQKGLRILEWWGVGGRHIYGNGEPIPIEPDQLKGRKIRVMETPFLVELYRNYGALATPMAWTEVYTALQQGVIEGVQASLAGYAVGHHEVSQWAVILDEQLTFVTFVVSERWWSKVPDDIKGQIRQAVKEATVIQHELDRLEEIALTKKWAGYGVKVVKGDRPAYMAKAKELYPKFGKLLGGDKWLIWIDEVGKAFPVEEYPAIKDYGGDYKF